METQQAQPYPFLPRFLFFVCVMVAVFVEKHLWIHLAALASFWLYEHTILARNAYRTPFLTQLQKLVPWVLFLLLFYGVFLQVGQTDILTLRLGAYTWTIYAESLFYAFHYVLLFVEVYWVTHLIYHEKKLDQLQYFFYGSLFPMTLVWNGSIQQSKHMMSQKVRFDEALYARGLSMARVKTLRVFFTYLIEHMLRKIYRQMPIFQSMWKNKVFYRDTWPEKLLWLVPLFFVINAFMQNEWVYATYIKIQTLTACLGVALLYRILQHQYEEMSPSRMWSWRDRCVVLFLALWLVVRLYHTQQFDVVNLHHVASLSGWTTGQIILGFIVFLPLLIFREASA